MKTVSQEKYDDLSQYMSAELLEANFKVVQYKLVDVSSEPVGFEFEVKGIPMLNASARVKLTDLAVNTPVVYQIVDIVTRQVVYVGQTHCARSRFEKHSKTKFNVYFEILEYVDLDEAEDRLVLETYHIKRSLRAGQPLTNKCHVVKSFKAD